MSDSAKPALLFLAHRLPYPPNKGDKIRSFQLLKYLAARYRVFLGTFIDDPTDEKYVDDVRAMCADLHYVRLRPIHRRLRSLQGLVLSEPLSLSYYRDQSLLSWVEATTARERITRVFAFSSPVAQYVMNRPQLKLVADLVDVDSKKWSQYALTKPWPTSQIYRREARRLLSFEREVALKAHTVLFVSDEETRLFSTLAPDVGHKAIAIGNGVDASYFDPVQPHLSPFAASDIPIVFTGAMDYWPNVDAAVWFANEVLPTINAAEPAARFYIVGMNPTPAVRKLGNQSQVVVTGRVPDVRPYLQHAKVVVAPLRIARGIQNKILEAMAMGRPVVTFAGCAEPIVPIHSDAIAIASDASDFAAKVLDLLVSPRASAMGAAARAYVLTRFDWTAKLDRIASLIEDSVSGRVAMPHTSRLDA